MASLKASPKKGTVVVTGANGSLGSTMASQIASTPKLAAYHGLYVVRGAKAAPVLRAALTQQHGAGRTTATTASPHAHNIISVNLADLDSVHAVAAGINAWVAIGKIPPVHTLVLNAGYLKFTL